MESTRKIGRERQMSAAEYASPPSLWQYGSTTSLRPLTSLSLTRQGRRGPLQGYLRQSRYSWAIAQVQIAVPFSRRGRGCHARAQQVEGRSQLGMIRDRRQPRFGMQAGRGLVNRYPLRVLETMGACFGNRWPSGHRSVQ